MTFIDRINKMEQIDQLIRLKATGSAREFANKLLISESSLYRFLDDLKKLGAEIKFDHSINSYRYQDPQKLFSIV